MKVLGRAGEPDRRTWALLCYTAAGGAGDEQSGLGAGLHQALDALFLAGIGRDRQQAWQRVEFPGSFARAGIRGRDVRQRCACHLPLIPFHPKAQTPGVGSVIQGGIRLPMGEDARTCIHQSQRARLLDER